jgi:hypothetical protein
MSVTKLTDFTDYQGAVAQITEFLEDTPLYVKLQIQLPSVFETVRPEVLELRCPTCKTDRPFRGEGRISPFTSDPHAIPPRGISQSGVRHLRFLCTGCERHEYEFWVFVNFRNETWIQKVGQLPIWIPIISKEMENELGDDAEIYKKALRNMNEGYGIGACAYLRRLLEKYINPLLQLLHDAKAETNGKPEELQAIKNAISAKEFTTKTRFAAEITPKELLVEGHNPFQEIHERLSVGLHTLDEVTANRYAQEIRVALEYIVRTLRRTHEERKAYALSIKEIRKLPVK